MISSYRMDMDTRHYYHRLPGNNVGLVKCMSRNGMTTRDPAKVNCPACLGYMEREAQDYAAWKLQAA